MLWTVPVCGQVGRCGHRLAGPDLSLTLSQVSRHVRAPIVSGQQLPLQGAQLLLKGTSWTVPEDQTSNFCLQTILVSALLSVDLVLALYLFAPDLQRRLHGEFL